MQASVKNILKLLGSLALTFIVFLIALIIALNIIIRLRAGDAQKQRANSDLLRTAQIERSEYERAGESGLKPTLPQQIPPNSEDLSRYAGQYVLIEGNCGDLRDDWFKYLPTFLTDLSGNAFSNVNRGWIFERDDWFSIKYYNKNTFNGKKLRHIKKWGFNSFLVGVTEDWEIDFSKFPEITAKDRLKRNECKYKYSK